LKTTLVRFIGILIFLTGFACFSQAAKEKAWTPVELPMHLPARVEVEGILIPFALDTASTGKGEIFLPKDYHPDKRGLDILVHFHSPGWLIRQEMVKENRSAIVVSVNYPGLSSSYRIPFSEDTGLFKKILTDTLSVATAQYPGAPAKIRILTIASFSAGYGAVREILKSPEYYRQIREIILMDSLYAGIEDTTSRKLVEKDVEPFIPFLNDAVKGKKIFISSHSAQLPKTYAGTPETNHYLIKKAHGKTQVVINNPDEVINQSGKLWLTCDVNRFRVRGYSGQDILAHSGHLYAFRYWLRPCQIGK
jgi:hypothetical protein